MSDVTEHIRTQLPDIGDGIQAQLHDLYRAPTAERCERAAINIAGAHATVMRLRERLIAEGEGHER